MDASKFKRDASRVHAALKSPGDGSVVAIKPVWIYIPARFAESQMAILGADTWISGIFCIAVEGQFYGVSTANAMMQISPTTVSNVRFGDDEYLEFYFEPGSRVIVNDQLVKNNSFIYSIYSELLAKGHVPWFLGYEDLGRIFQTSHHHTGTWVGANDQILEMIVASLARDRDNRMTYYRHTVDSKQALVTRPPVVIPLRSVTYGATNTTAKLMGSYMEEGLVSAIVNPAEKVEPIEALLRM